MPSSRQRQPGKLSRDAACVIVTGLSGAGKSHALRALEDIGYFCVDNVPLDLLPSLIAHYERSGHPLPRIAAGVDVRTGTERFRESLERLSKSGWKPTVLFLDADDQTLLRRYSETRRRHPLSGSVVSGIARERRSLNEVKAHADKIVDTSTLTPTEMKEVVVRMLGLRHPRGTAVVVTSFGYKYGVPLDADLVWDVRFLPNPHFVPALKPFTGTKPAVARYVLDNPEARRFLSHLMPMMDFLLESFAREGKSYLTIAIGCTGGRHRSVAVSEALARHIRELGRDVRVLHRDADRRV